MEKRVRVNITVDAENLEKAKTKLKLFGGKLSTLFDAYLEDFIKTMDKNYSANSKEIQSKIIELEKRLEKLEKK